jgi:hypothetical protein
MCFLIIDSILNWRGGSGGIKNKKTSPYRNFVDDDVDVPKANRLTKAQKSNMLDLMLGQIANYCPIISHNGWL